MNLMSIDIKSSDWDSLISGKSLVAADFWAAWCPYCVRLKPIFDSVSKDYPDIKFVKVNVQDQADLASRYGIRGIPVIKFFCEGREVGEIVGFVPSDELKKQVEGIAKNAVNCLLNTSITSKN
jgi:thioredoxin 1